MAVQINVAANQAALTASIQAGVQAYNQRFAQNNPINLSINQRAFSQPLGRMTGDVKDFEAALAASNARVIAFGASTAVLGGIIRSFKELANVTIDVEKNLADINRVFGLSTSQLQKFSTDLFSVGKQTASSFDDASKAALEFSRQGLKAEEVLIRTKDALTLARVAGISTANSVDALTSTVNGFAATGVTTSQILNKLVAVEQDFAVGAGDLAEALSRTGQAAQEAGVSLDQLNALVTAAQQSTARGGAVIGNALKTIFTRLQRTETLDQLEAFNIAVRDVQGNTLPAVTVLQNFAGAYKNLGDAQRAQLSEQVAGVYQVNILKAIVGDLNKSQGVYAGALQRGASATNEAEVATAKLNQTLDALLKQTATSTQQLANNIGKVTFEPLARYGTEQLKSLVESMNEILEGEGVGSTFANGLLKGIRNVIAGPGAIAAFFTLFKLIQNSFTYLAQALPQIAGITTETQNRKNIESAILQIMAQQGTVAQALDGLTGNQAAQAQLLLQTARAQTAEYQKQAALAQQLSVQLSGQGVKVAGNRGLQVTRAGGYIPNATRMAEAVGAQAGGYAPGKVVKSPVGGVMNTAEDVKYVPGFAQPFINPPAESKAGRAHRQNAISRTGVDPYMNSGFIPNFAVSAQTKEFLNSQGFSGKLNKLPLKTKNQINKISSVADVYSFIEEGKYAEDSITGEGIHYVVKEIGEQTNTELRKEASDIALKGNKDLILENIPKGKSSLVDFAIWDENRKLSQSNKNAKVKSLIDSNKEVSFSRQLVGLTNLIAGEIFEKRVAELAKVKKKENSNARFDFHPSDIQKYLGGEAKSGSFNMFDLIAKAIGSKNQKYNQNGESDDIPFDLPIELFVPKTTSPNLSNFSKGFIPNFAIPVDSARIPWFKKYASSYKNTASDKDIFRQIDFPTYGKGLDHTYAKIGNPDMVSFLYEDFVRSAMNIALGSKQVIRSKEAGFKNTPTNAISNRDPIDLAKKLSGGKFRMLEVKQSKDNQKQTISQISDAKLRGLFEENPELAKNVELMSIIFNDPKYVDPTGKSPDGVLNPFEQSIAPIVKNSYANVDSTMRGKLGLLTDGLMRRYQSKKNSFSKGFIPDSANNIDATSSAMREILDLMPFVVDLKNRRYAEGDMFHYQIANSKFFDKETKKLSYGSLSDEDMHGSVYSDTFVRGFYIPSLGKVDYELTKAQKKDKNFMPKHSELLDKIKARYAERFAKQEESRREKPGLVKPKVTPPSQMFRNQHPDPYLVNHFNNGFIPNFGQAKISTKFFRAQRDGKPFLPKEGIGTDLLGTKMRDEYAQKIPKGSFLFDQFMNNIAMSVMGPNAYVPDASAIDGKIFSNKEQTAESFAKTAALNLSADGAETSFGLEKGFLVNAFGNARKVHNPDLVYSGKLSGKVRTTKYNNLGKVLGKFWSRSPETKAAWEYLGDLVESGKYASEDKEKIKSQTAILTKDYNAFMKKHDYAATIVKMDDFRTKAEGVEKGVTIAALRDDSFGLSEVENLTTKNYKSKGVNYGEYKLNKREYDKIGRWKYDNLTKKMFLQNKGFIPNFAYKQAVMGLEESMSGNKAIFDSKPFPHIRNKSQPTFSSAVADHGGLSNALSDSMRGQKDAGLMSGGFVPNFADFSSSGIAIRDRSGRVTSRNPIDTAINNYIKSIDLLNTNNVQINSAVQKILKTYNLQAASFNELLKQVKAHADAERNAANQTNANASTSKSLSEKLFGAKGIKADKFASSKLGGIAGVVGGALIGGQLENLIQGGRDRSQLSTGEKFAASASSGILTATTTGAEIGSMIPGLGTAAGAAIGALIGLGKAAYDSQDSLEDLQKSSEFYKSQVDNIISSSGSYIQQLKELSSISDPSLLNQASFKLSETFQNLSKESPELGRKFMEAGGDIDKMGKAIEDFTSTANMVKSINNLKTSYKESGDKLSFTIPVRSNQLAKKGYNIQQGSGDIKETEASLQTSFVQFQGFFDLLKKGGLTAENSSAFMEEFQKEMQGYTSESDLAAIAKKYNISETIAKELADLSDNVIDEMGVEGDFFVANSGVLVKRFFDATNDKYKSAAQQIEKQTFNARPIIKRIEDSISNYVFNMASQLQSMEFESSRFKILENAANNYLDSISTPLEKASREISSRNRETETKTEASRIKFTSNFEQNIGSKLPKALGGSDAGTLGKLEALVESFKTSSQEQQLDQINKLIKNTNSVEAASAAGYKNIDPNEVKSLNADLIKERASLISLMQAKKEDISLMNLENDITKTKAESYQRLLQIQNKLVKTESERAIIAARQLAMTDVAETRFKTKTETPGYGFGVSNIQIAKEKINAERSFMQERNFTANQNRLNAAKDAINTPTNKIITNLRNAIPPQKIVDPTTKNIDLEALNNSYKQIELNQGLADSFDEFSKRLSDTKSLTASIDVLTEFRNTLEKTVNVNTDAYSDLFTTITKQIEQSKTELIKLDSETEKFEINAQANIKTADVNDRINNAYIYRLNVLLQIEKAQRKVLNTIEIEEQRLDAAKSRPANFFGLGVTGKAEKQIGFDEQNLALRQRRQNAQATQNVQQQLSQFEIYRSKTKAESINPLLQEGSYGPLNKEQTNKAEEARKAIANLDTSKITNVDQAKAFVSELSNIRNQYGLQGEAAKTLADTEKEINSILNSNVDELDKMRSIQDILNGKVRQEARDRQSIKMGFKEGFDQIQEDADTGLNKLAKDTPALFRDGMVNAIKAAVKETDNLGDALLGVAANFLDTISSRLMEVGVSKLISGSGIESLFTAQKGGVVRAQSGMYISGTGSGDKYPAMLENGEYVLNRNAVMAMGGPASLDKLNFSDAPRFAAGGSFSNKFEDISSMESNMTSYGLEESKLYNELRDQKRAEIEAARQKKRAEKQQRAALIGSLAGAAVSLGISAGVNKFSKPGGYASTKAGKLESKTSLLGNQEAMTIVNGRAVMPSSRQVGGSIGSRLSDTVPAYATGGLIDSPVVKRYAIGGVSSSGFGTAAGNNSTVNNNSNASNSFNFNTTVQRDGKIQMGANSTSYTQQDVELSQNLNSKVYDVVLDTIRKEKRFGGSLAGIRN